LIYLGASGEAEPGLAERIESLTPGAMRIWLRREATFSDGAAVTAQDVEHSLVGPAIRCHQEEGGSILIESDGSGAAIELQLAGAYIHRRVAGSNLGTGGFVLSEEDEHHILLRRRAPARGHVESVLLVAYESPQEAFAHTLKGDADYLPEVDPRWIELVEGVPRLRVTRLPTAFANVVGFNSARLSREERLKLVELFRNSEVRKLAFGDECAAPVQAPSPPTTGKPLERDLDVLAVSFFERFGLAVRRTLGDHGGRLRLDELHEFTKTAEAHDFDLLTWRPRIRPPILAAQSWRTGGAYNVVQYSNPRVDAAIDARDWRAVQRELADDPPFALICDAVALAVMDSRITNVKPTHFWANLVNWQVPQ
jgi:ABC-type transport system substrate-binding protein